MERKVVKIFDIPIDHVTNKEATQKLIGFLNNNKTNTVFTPNAEIMMLAKKESDLRVILSSADLLVPDGAGVILGSKILGTPLPERVAGFDLTCSLLSYKHKNPLKIFLFGSKPENIEKSKIHIEKTYPHVEIVGYHHGYFDSGIENSIIHAINDSNAQVLLVALGAPRQERWIYNNLNKLNVQICMGIGGTLDVFAGTAKRAPEFFQKYGLEWLYRLCKEPSRFIRMLALPQFVFNVIIEKFKK